MGKSQRDKGARVERRIVSMFENAGIPAQRIGFLPALGIPVKGDVKADDKHYEVKARKNGAGFKKIQEWLEGCYGLVLVENNKEPLVVLRISDYFKEVPHVKIRNNPGNDI